MAITAASVPEVIGNGDDAACDRRGADRAAAERGIAGRRAGHATGADDVPADGTFPRY